MPVSDADYEAVLAINRRLHAQIAQANAGERCGRCWALMVNGHHPDCTFNDADGCSKPACPVAAALAGRNPTDPKGVEPCQ